MLSACRIYVSSKKARFKYILKYIQSMEETGEQDKLIQNCNFRYMINYLIYQIRRIITKIKLI